MSGGFGVLLDVMMMSGDSGNGSVHCVKDFVGYQSGSVVSRALIDRKVGTVTFFAFDRGEGLSEHTAPYDALVMVTDGVAEIVLGGEVLRVSEGEMVVMPADVPHALRAVERFKMVLVMIRE